jgi:CBS domain-containing protein
MEAVMKAIDVMVRDVITIGPDDSIADAAKLIAITTSAHCRWSTTMATWSASSARATS